MTAKVWDRKITPVFFSGNLTKHMKSKAHMKKCLELGVSPTAMDNTEDAGRNFTSVMLGSSITNSKAFSLAGFVSSKVLASQ